MKEIGVIVNKKAKRNKKDPTVVERVREIVGKYGLVEVTERIEDIAESIKKMVYEKVKIIGISGGDGTFHQTLTEIIRSYKDRAMPYIVHLRQGTMNTIAKGFKIKDRQEEILSRLKNLIEGKINATPKIIQRPTICVNGRYGFVFGTGLPSNFLSAYYDGKLRGPLKAIYMIVRGFFSYIFGGKYAKKITQPLNCTVEVDGVKVSEGLHTGVLVSTVANMGLGMKVMYRAEKYIDRFQVLAARVSPLVLIAHIPRFWLALPPKVKNMVDIVGQHFVLTSPSPVLYTIDGDMYTADGHVELTIGPVVKTIKV